MVPKRAFMLPKKTFRTFRKFEVVLLGSLNYEIFYCLFRKDLHVFLGSCNVENKGWLKKTYECVNSQSVCAYRPLICQNLEVNPSVCQSYTHTHIFICSYDHILIYPSRRSPPHHSLPPINYSYKYTHFLRVIQYGGDGDPPYWIRDMG